MIRSIADFCPPVAEGGVGLALQDAQGRYLFFIAGPRHYCPPGELFYAGEDEQVVVHVADRSYPIRPTLTELEARLDPQNFFRVHRSAIVNLDCIQEIHPWLKGGHVVRLSTGAQVDLSRARARALRRILGW